MTEIAPIPYLFEDAPKEAHIEFQLSPAILKSLPGTPSKNDFEIEMSTTSVRIALKGQPPIIEELNSSADLTQVPLRP